MMLITWFSLLILPLTVVAFRCHLPPWLFMWSFAFSIFSGFKWLTWQDARKKGVRPNLKRLLAYLFLWPGMNAQDFLEGNPLAPTSSLEWVKAFLKTSLGCVLFWGVARLIPVNHPLFKGWIGMIGLIFILHFGTFHLLALFWRSRGIQAEHMFQSPALSSSLADFWGKRWNRGFHQLSHQFIFQPLRSRIGVPGATLMVFLFSGLIHDLVISFPAGGGYGLPTIYFGIQGVGVLVERSLWGRRRRTDQGLRGWLFTFIFTAGPAFWLFHPLFISKVILPFMKVTGAL